MFLSTLFCRKSAARQQGTKSARGEKTFPRVTSSSPGPALSRPRGWGGFVGGLKCCLVTGGEREEDEERERQMARGWGERGQD